jgi:hypothetical protein
VQVSTHLSRDAARLLGLCPRATNWPQICAGQAAPPVHAPTMHQQHRQSILHRHPHPLIDHPLVHQGRWDACVQIGATHVVPGLLGLAEPLKACDRMAATAFSQQNVLASCASPNPGWEHGAAARAPTTSRHPPSGHLLPAMTGTITHRSPRHWVVVHRLKASYSLQFGRSPLQNHRDLPTTSHFHPLIIHQSTHQSHFLETHFCTHAETLYWRATQRSCTCDAHAAPPACSGTSPSPENATG